MKKNSHPELKVAALVGEMARECILTRSRRISRVITNIYDEALRPHGINSPQFSLMALIYRLDGASRAEIGRANYQERSTLARNLALLQAAGWVQEMESEGGRSRPLSLSAAGRNLLELAGPAWRSAQEKTRALMGAEAAASMIAMVDQIPLDQLAE